MSKIAKYFLIGLGLIIAIVSLLMVMALVFIDPNAYRQQLVQIVKTQTGRNLEISGEVSLSLFPWLGVQFGEMQLAGPAGFEPTDFASLRQANIKVAVLPLLWGRVDIDHILIDGLSLNLLRTKQGHNNWTFPANASQTKKTELNKNKNKSGSSLAAVRLGSLTLKNSSIHWHDKQSGSKIMADHLGLTLDHLASGEQADFSLVTDLTLAKNKAMPIAVSSKIMIDWRQQVAQLISSKIELSELVLETQLTARFLDNLKIEGSAKLRKMAPLSALRLFGIDYKPENKKVFRSLQANMNFTYLSDSLADPLANTLELKNISIILDKAELTGNVLIGLDDKKQSKFDLLLKNINTDHYLPAKTIAQESDAARPSKSVSKKKVDDTISLPVSLLRSLNISGQLELENIRTNGIGFNSINTKLVSRAGLLTLKPFHAKLYKGNTQGNFQLDTRKNNPRYTIVQNLKNIQIGDLLKDMDIYDKFSGKGDLKIDVTTTGSKVSTLKKNLKGTLSIKLKKGKLVGADFIRQLREARDLYERLQGKQKAQSKRTGNETVYDQLTASAIITKGVINNQDLLLVGPKLQITGKGQIDLPRNWIYYRLKARYQEKQGVDPIKAPIKVKGPLDNPSIKVEYQKVLRKESEKYLRKEVEKALEKELRKGLENLFK